MAELLTAAQMRAIEQAAIDSGEVTGLELMERAGQGVVEAIFEEWPELAANGAGGAAPHPGGPDSPRGISGERKAVVLCGPGNNGGDGFVVARLLRARGWKVEVFLYGDPSRLPPDARVNHERWLERGEVEPIDACTSGRWADHPLMVDALFGTGLARSIPEKLRGILAATLNCRRVCIDIPSILCSDTGTLLNDWPEKFPLADLTIAFHSEKLGHRLASGAELCGRVKVVDIGLQQVSRGEAAARLVDTPMAGDLGKITDHKYTHGHALILSGPTAQTGAARLAARGALRIGAGLVTVGSPGDALAENAAQLTAIMLTEVDGAQGLATVLADDRINALCLGPALELDRARELVPVALGIGGLASRPTVLDADALTAFADAPEVLFEMLHAKCVLTPHAGEFARLFPDIAEKLNASATKGSAYSKVDATREAAARAGCVVLFKGPDTVIAAPDGRCSINSAHYERSAPWLATAGSGDVLAGFIAGLLARGLAPMQAAETAAWLHVECALSFGPGLIAEDLPEELPKVFKVPDRGSVNPTPLGGMG